MALVTVTGATILCPNGIGTGMLNVTSQTTVTAEGKPAATIKDCAPGSNLNMGGVMCTSMANPQVASATAAALGVLTPQPCVPAPVGTWSAVNPCCQAGGTPCLLQGSTINCAYAGTISIIKSGQTKVNVS